MNPDTPESSGPIPESNAATNTAPKKRGLDLGGMFSGWINGIKHPGHHDEASVNPAEASVTSAPAGGPAIPDAFKGGPIPGSTPAEQAAPVDSEPITPVSADSAAAEVSAAATTASAEASSATLAAPDLTAATAEVTDSTAEPQVIKA